MRRIVPGVLMVALLAALASSPADAMDQGGQGRGADPPRATPTLPFPRTIDEIPADFEFLPVAGLEDRSVPVIVPDDVSPAAGLRALPRYVVSNVITAGTCKYRQRADYIHISSTSPRAVSVHGYWKIEPGSGTCPAKANVDTRLQAYGCGSFTGCGWVDVAFKSTDVAAGGGSGRVSVARRECSSTTTVVYREQIDVDLIGVSDPSGYSQGVEKQVTCYPK